MKKMGSALFLIIMVMGLVSCKEYKTENGASEISRNNKECFTEIETEKIVNSIFNNDYILKHMDPRVKNSSLPLKILSNELIEKKSNQVSG
ncbi:hypothetical protein ACOCEA_03990 [Maribacter sp. CXY002]|uniref:hypothetical protein n=1 Tax=Maribacter luteocoastalis TaxID=3407671 RepID=UPI003B67723A